MWSSIKHLICRAALRIAVRSDPNLVKQAMMVVFVDQMMKDGVASMEFGFDEEGDPAIIMHSVDGLPKVTRH